MRRLARGLAEALVALAAVALVVMMGATVVDVVGRHALSAPLPGVVEIVEFTMVWATFLGIAAGFALGGHITVDLVDLLAGRTARWVAGAARIVIVAAMVLLVWLAWRELGDAIEWGDTTVDLGIPHTAYWVGIFGGYLAGAVLALAGTLTRAS